MKYIDGIFNIAIGAIFLLAPPIGSIDYSGLRLVAYRFPDEIMGNKFYISGRGDWHTLYEYSYGIMLAGMLFIAYGIFKIWRAKNENSQQGD